MSIDLGKGKGQIIRLSGKLLYYSLESWGIKVQILPLYHHQVNTFPGGKGSLMNTNLS